MVWTTYCDGIFSHKSFKRSVAEMSATITDYSTRDSEVQKMFSFKNLTTTLLSFVLLGIASTHFRHIVHNNQDVLIPKWTRKRTM